jgi:Amt family ammonium transporter
MGALIGCMELGPRKDNRMVPGNLPLTAIGTGMLWVGWYGFNGGSAVAAGADAAFACLATQLAAATAACVWTAQDVLQTGKATLLGACTGSIAGLATVTPAAGVVGPLGAVCLGAAAGIICRYASLTVKEKVGYDDSLDVVGVHGVGGFIGTILLSIFGSAAFGGFNPVPASTQLPIQMFAAITATIYTGAASYVCLKIADKLAGGLRAPPEAEDSGMDAYSHGEAAITLSAEETR